MSITTTVVGSYPKPPDEGRPFVVRKTLHAIERQEAGSADLDSALNDLVKEMISEQEDAGVDIVTDGQARWDDILTPFARVLNGFEIGGLLRWFDNNVYYRRPVCMGEVSFAEPASVSAFEFAKSAATKPVKAVVPGPVTFARLSLDEHYGDHSKFVLALAAAIGQEVSALQEAGCRHIAIDEPALCDAPEDLALAAQALGVVTDGLDAEVTLQTYFGDVKRLGAEFFSLPAQVIALDLVAGPANLEVLRDFPNDATLQAGIVDARNTRLESVADLSSRIDEITALVPTDRLRLAPSAPLEFLPREKARAKLKRLAEIATVRNGG
jgi:5-methyltetrahydropteroyltriglutamate--homocysteine methyltransferase